MKHLTAWFLSVALLLSLCACGAGAESAVSAQESAEATEAPVISASEDSYGYVIPTAWTEDSLNDGTWGYVTAAAELPVEGSLNGGYLESSSQDQDTGATTLVRYALDGTELYRVEIPAMDGPGDSYVSNGCFGESGVWLLHTRYVIIDEDTGETESYTELQQWSYDGACLTAVPIDSDYGQEGEDIYTMGLELDADGNPILMTWEYLYFCDETGQPAAYMERGDTIYDFCRDAHGRLYLYDSFECQLYTIDWENHTLGSVLFTADGSETVQTGSGGYDFLLKSDATLRGVTLETGTITEILSWSDCGLSGSVGSVLIQSEDSLLVSSFNMISYETKLLTLTRVPADQIPEKTVVRLAVGLSQSDIDSWGATWTDALDQKVTAAVNQFNLESDTYRVEVETYASAEDLNLKLAAGDAPDIIDWNQTAWLEDTPSMAIYANRGYLVDLEPLFAADPELSTDDFIPNILELAMGRTGGGLYVMPLCFYFVTLSIPTEYVGDATSWTISDMLAVAESLPEDTVLWDSIQTNMLDLLLRTDLSEFVDMDAWTCDFETQSFYDLLTLCRDYFPAEYDENNSKTALLLGHMTMGSLGNFAADELPILEEQGRTLIGYPGAGGSVSIIFYDDYSICALGAQQEGAWEFLRTLYTYEFQYNYAGM